jgi:hypothetical protein
MIVVLSLRQSFIRDNTDMKYWGSTLIPVVAFCALCSAITAQSSADAPCTLPPPAFTSNAPNIFNDQQEEYLGDALSEYTETKLRLAAQPADDLLTRIGEKLLATLPPTEVHYRFRIYDSAEINAFSLAGGRVYISRKLISAVKSEDELAGVIAHEIGHIRTHQSAIEFTRAFHIRLGVNEVTDRADIYAKVHRFLSTPPKPQEEESSEVNDELVADHVALYAMVRAGYATESFASFLNESTMNKGKTGSWLSNLLGVTREDPKRYGAALKLIGELPTGCKEKKSGTSEAFATWLRGVVEERIQVEAGGLDGDQPVKLDPPLHPSLWRIRFSPDGRTVLAQDEGSITVVDREAGKVLFQINAPDANGAQFTPDSASVVFNDGKLRVETWSVAKGQRSSVNEMVVYDGCNQTMLSADGRTLMCSNVNIKDNLPRISLRLIDVESGRAFYEKPGFFETSAFAPYYSLLSLAIEGMSGADLVTMKSSPDGRYMLAVVGSQVLAYDVAHRLPVALDGKLKYLTQGQMSFLGPDEVLVVGNPQGKDLRKAQILTFPGGQVLKDTVMGNQGIGEVSKGRFVIAGPLKDYAVGILDPYQAKFLVASKQAAIDASDPFVATEDTTGGLAIGKMGVAGSTRIPLPLGPLPRPQAAAFSPDGKYLAVSLRSRGEVWSLDTGKRVSLSRPFRSAWIDDANHLFGQFPKFMERDPVELRITLASLDAKEMAKYEREDEQYHDLQIRFNPMGKEKSIRQHATMEVKKMESQAVLWTKEYSHETPAWWQTEDDRLVLAWDLSTDSARSEIKDSPDLQRQMEGWKNQKKGLLVETVSPETGALLEKVVIPEADISRGWHDARWAKVSGEYVLVHGEHENTVIYRLDTGAKVGEFFGTVFASDAETGIAVSATSDDAMLLVDERTGKELKRFSLGSPVRAARIVTGKEKLLLVLTADQTVHRLPLPQ